MAETDMDFIFLLEDNTYLHFEFQTTYNKNDLIRFATYDLRLFERDGRSINTVVIYTADVKEPPISLQIGSLIYNPSRIMMNLYDGNAIYEGLHTKTKSGRALSEVDMLNLIFLPFMRNNIPKYELAIKSIQLAQTIKDKVKRNTCIASVLAFANRYLDENKLNKLLEALKMTDLATMFLEELTNTLIENAVSDKAVQISKNALKKGFSIADIADITGLDEATIEKLKKEMES